MKAYGAINAVDYPELTIGNCRAGALVACAEGSYKMRNGAPVREVVDVGFVTYAAGDGVWPGDWSCTFLFAHRGTVRYDSVPSYFLLSPGGP